MRNSRLRVLISAALLAAVIYFVRTRQNTTQPPASTGPLLSEAPSAEGANRFAWIPRYPGAELQDIQTSQGRNQISYAFSFSSTDAPAKVAAYYETQLRSLGFTVVSKDLHELGTELHGENPDRRRMIDVKAASTPAGSQVGVAAVDTLR